MTVMRSIPLPCIYVQNFWKTISKDLEKTYYKVDVKNLEQQWRVLFFDIVNVVVAHGPPFC